jgi:hypothetical protein
MAHKCATCDAFMRHSGECCLRSMPSPTSLSQTNEALYDVNAAAILKVVSMQISREHHFVPRFLLRRWAAGDVLTGLYWATDGKIRQRRLGVGAFCKELDLLTINAQGLPPDALEKEFFGPVDAGGAAVTERLLKDGPDALTADERSDFARFLLSLEARYPEHVAKLKTEGAYALRNQLDYDPEVLQALAEPGEVRKPSAILEEDMRLDFASRALLVVQMWVENPKVGGRLVNAAWRVYHLRDSDGTLILGDRPLFRWRGFDHPDCFWLLPLTPTAVFVAANHAKTIHALNRATGLRLRKAANQNTIPQAARYVFVVDDSHNVFIEKNLPKPPPP